jgi:hypothetical protein
MNCRIPVHLSQVLLHHVPLSLKLPQACLILATDALVLLQVSVAHTQLGPDARSREMLAGCALMRGAC